VWGADAQRHRTAVFISRGLYSFHARQPRPSVQIPQFSKKILLSVDERALSTARQRDRQALFRNDTSRQRACARHPEL
jgi:hypothetical protein